MLNHQILLLARPQKYRKMLAWPQKIEMAKWLQKLQRTTLGS
jgi:hypothetical protein